MPGDHFGTLVQFCLDADPAAARSMALPFIPRGRVDAPTLDACTAFGPAELVSERFKRAGNAASAALYAKKAKELSQQLE